jgi:Tol biopolymer transport system component
LYVSDNGTSESIWKLADGVATELWTGPDTQIVGGPAIAPDGDKIAFSVRHNERTVLYEMKADGTNARTVTDALELRGDPAWTPDGHFITSAAVESGEPRLYRVPVAGGAATPLVREYSIDPVWAPDGGFAVYSGADIGTTFPLRAVTPSAQPYPLRPLTLTRGARRLRFLRQGRVLVFLRGEIRHKNLWRIDLDTGMERQLTNFAPDFEIQDFDISPDGREVVVERVQEDADVVRLELRRP